MIDLEVRKRYNYVVHIVGWNSYEKDIGHGRYKFSKESKFEAGNVLTFSIRSHADFMSIFLIRGWWNLVLSRELQ